MALINDFLSLIYPRHCEACSNTLFAHEHLLCTYCRVNLPRSHFHVQRDNELSRLFYGRVPFLSASAYYLYEKSGRVQKLIHSIKYQKQFQLAEHLGSCYATELQEIALPGSVDLLVPIPLHPKKQKIRGFNQSEYFARGMGRIWNKEVNTSLLKRIRETSTQTRKKKYERWENVEGIFTTANPEALEQKHVMLVDDVITTGATLEAAWMALQGIPSIRVSVVSMAFASRSFAGLAKDAG